MKKYIGSIITIILLTIMLIIIGAEFNSHFSFYIISSIPLVLTILYSLLDYQQKQERNKSIAQEKNFRTFFQSINDMLFVMGSDGHIIYANQKVYDKLKYNPGELDNLNILKVHYITDNEEAARMFNEVLDNKRDHCPFPLLYKDGSKLLVDTRIWHGDWYGKPCIYCVSKDITDQQIALDKFTKIFNNNTSLMALTSVEDRTFVDVNNAFINILGYSKDEILGKRITEVNLFANLDKLNELRDLILENNRIINYELDLIRKDGNIINGICSAEIIESHNKRLILTILTDYTEQKKKQDEIEYLSYHDSLTELHNRVFYEKEMIKLDKKNKLPLSIIMADVNGLKLTNDAFGHKKGDELLRKIGKILSDNCKDTNYTLARIGGDEFIILMPNTNNLVAEEFVINLRKTIDNINMNNVIPSVSFGLETREDMSIKITEIFKNAEDNMYHNKLAESGSMRNRTISIIMKTLYEKNKIEEEHSQRVSKLSRELAIAMGMSDYDINELELAGLMHDIGKIGVDIGILNKPTQLNQLELNEIKKHSEIGYRILSSVNDFSQIANIVLNHHERWDGNGYPNGLKGEDIPLKSRIITIADAYDAMTSERAYKKPLSQEYAIDEIIKHSGTQFDPQIVKIMVENVLNKVWIA